MLELAKGGELFDKIIERTKLNEVEAKMHFYKIAATTKYLHSKNICHRDLKPENFLLCTMDDANPIVNITDIGTVLKNFCGTPQYIAPEVVTSAGLQDTTYTLKVDSWSLHRPDENPGQGQEEGWRRWMLTRSQTRGSGRWCQCSGPHS